MLSALTIFAASYAIEAGINFGVITSCIALSTPFNCLFSYIFFNERLTKKMCVGTLILFAGIMWVSLSKEESSTVNNEIAKFTILVEIYGCVLIQISNSSVIEVTFASSSTLSPSILLKISI